MTKYIHPKKVHFVTQKESQNLNSIFRVVNGGQFALQTYSHNLKNYLDDELYTQDDLASTVSGVQGAGLIGYNGWNGYTTVKTAIDGIGNLFDATSEPTGFESRHQSTISFDDATRTLTITPKGAYTIWHAGVPTTINTVKTITLPTDYGVNFIYFDEDGTLQQTTTFSDDLLTKYVYVSFIIWDSNTSTSLLVADERHGIRMDSRTHEYLHNTTGARWASGGALTNILADQSGASNTHATFGISDVIIWDEDLKHDSSLLEQVLTNPAQIPVAYLTGAGQFTSLTTINDYPVADAAKVGSGTRLHWNELSGGTWSLTEATDGKFVLCHIIVTNDYRRAVVAQVGIAEYATVTGAREAALTEIQTIAAGGLQGAEIVVLATVIYQTKDSYTNTPNARIRSTGDGADYVDWREATLGGVGAVSVTDHGVLTGLGDDDHLQYALLLGRSGGQTLIGGTDSGDDLVLQSTSNATKGSVIIRTASSGATPIANYDDLFVENSGSCGITIAGGTSSLCGVMFADSGSATRGYVSYSHSTDGLSLGTADNTRVYIDSTGQVGIGTSGPATAFDVNADSIRVRTSQSPASNGTGTQGEIAWDSDFLYVCVSSNVWKRVALTGGY